MSITAAASAEAALASGTSCRLLFGTTEVEARLRLLDRDSLEPGASTQAQLHLAEPVAVPAREPYVLRLDSPAATIAGGRILDPASRRRRRNDPRVLADLAALAGGKPEQALAVRLGQAGATGAPLAELARLAGTAPDRARTMLRGSGAREVGDRFIGGAAFEALQTGILAALAQHHRDSPMEHGIALERLSRSLKLPDTLVGTALRALTAAGTVSQAGTLWRRADFDPARNESEAARRLEQIFRRAGLEPARRERGRGPGRAAAGSPDLSGRRRDGDPRRGPGAAPRRPVPSGSRRGRPGAPHRGLPECGDAGDRLPRPGGGGDAGDLPQVLDSLLEHLDATGFTRRAGDRRIIVALEPGSGSATSD